MNRTEIFSGLVWKFGEKLSAQLMSFGISIVLARLLMPKDYGVIALIMIFINIANVFVTTGFGEALIQKVNCDEDDYSAAFALSLLTSIGVYMLFFILAPRIGEYYKIYGSFTSMIRVLALKLPLSSLSTIQQAYISKNMMFKKLFFISMISTLLSGVVGIIMAANNMNAWALIYQYLIGGIITMVLLLFYVPWKPSMKISLIKARTIFEYSWKLIFASLINSIYSEFRSILIGGKYTVSDLAFFNRGNIFPSLIINNIDVTIVAVLFPAMAIQKRDGKIESIKLFTKKSIKFTAFIVFPLMAGLFAVAEPLVIILLTDKWINAVVYLKLGCIYYASQPIQSANWQALKVLGRSDLCLKYEVIKKFIGIFSLLVVMNNGVLSIAIVSALMGIVMMLINMYPSSILLKYSYFEQFKDLLSSGIASIFMGAFVIGLQSLLPNTVLSLLIQITLGFFAYIFLCITFGNEELRYFHGLIRNKLA